MSVAKVSVIIPNYNHARYLNLRIDSVLNQSFKDFDVLIMDDRSPDDSMAVIEQYRDRPNVTICANEQNSGNTFMQWKKGLELTRSDYVWIAESDDWAEPAFLERMTAALDANPNAGMAVCESMIVDGEGQEIALYFDNARLRFPFRYYDLDAFKQDGVHDGLDYMRRFMVPFSTIPNASAVLFRRSALEGIIDTGSDMRLCGDWLVYCRILIHHGIVRIAEPLNRFRKHSNNVRSKTSSVEFLQQQRKVRAMVRHELGDIEQAASARHAIKYETQLLVQAYRPGKNGKVAFKNMPALLGNAWSMGGGLFPQTVILLLREGLAGALGSIKRTSSFN